MALSEDQRLIQDTARQFAFDRLRPNAGTWDRGHIFPKDVIREAASLGFAGIYVREDVGGSALGRLDAALVFEQLARGCVATSAFISIHNMASWMIDRFGDEEQRQRWLPRLTAMDLMASYALTEPGSGSDAAALRTTARKDGNSHYVLNGAKAFISGAPENDLYVCMVRTGEAGPKGISTLVIEKGTPGLSFGKQEDKMGWNAQPTAQVIFEDCRVPVENRLNVEGFGFKIAMMGLDGGRLNIAASSLGGAQDAFERAWRYSRERHAFGQPIGDFQATQFKLADMATDLEAARVFLYEAAARLDAQDPEATKFCAMAKRFVTDAGFRVANEALQIHGGYGYLADYEVERIVRDVRVNQILEGTNEIMRVIIARELGKG
ncbi:MAG: acyl-CoA dehydrogenase family protein [Hyphomonadaceae bacterium]|nr:acyl-CoA dehydrogenase family protein [Hyphomonadaceae bacterium]